MIIGDQLVAAMDLSLLARDSTRCYAEVKIPKGSRVEVIDILETGTFADHYYPAAILKIVATGEHCNIYTAGNNRVEKAGILLPVSPLVLLAECAEAAESYQHEKED